MDKTDLAALELALAQTLAGPDPGRVNQITTMLQQQNRVRVAEFCSYHQQVKNLQLQPWQSPPCWMGDPDKVLASTATDTTGERDAATLLLRMQEFGISQYHPDPLAAIEAACDKIKRRHSRRSANKSGEAVTS